METNLSPQEVNVNPLPLTTYLNTWPKNWTLRTRKRDNLLRGQVDSVALRRNNLRVQQALGALFYEKRARAGSKGKRADMALAALQLQASHGQLFASAQFLADQALGSKKTWGRLLAKLRGEGLAETVRLITPDNRESVNQIDLSRLWKYLLSLLNRPRRFISRGVPEPSIAAVEKVGGRLWVKVGAFWEIRGLPAPEDARP